MATLADQFGTFLEIQPLEYLYTITIHNIRLNWDANWMRLFVQISEGGQAWSSKSEMITQELTDFASWLEAVITDRATLNSTFEPINRALRFELKAVLDRVHLTGYFAFELCPPEKRGSRVSLYDGVPIEFYLTFDEVRAFVDALRIEMEPFPVRDIEGTGRMQRSGPAERDPAT